jgi:hypothetical protein
MRRQQRPVDRPRTGPHRPYPVLQDFATGDLYAVAGEHQLCAAEAQLPPFRGPEKPQRIQRSKIVTETLFGVPDKVGGLTRGRLARALADQSDLGPVSCGPVSFMRARRLHLRADVDRFLERRAQHLVAMAYEPGQRQPLIGHSTNTAKSAQMTHKKQAWLGIAATQTDQHLFHRWQFPDLIGGVASRMPQSPWVGSATTRFHQSDLCVSRRLAAHGARAAG